MEYLTFSAMCPIKAGRVDEPMLAAARRIPLTAAEWLGATSLPKARSEGKVPGKTQPAQEKGNDHKPDCIREQTERKENRGASDE